MVELRDTIALLIGKRDKLQRISHCPSDVRLTRRDLSNVEYTVATKFFDLVVSPRSINASAIFGHDKLRAATPLTFSERWGNCAGVGDIQDPRQRAYDFLRANVPADILHNPRLDGLLEWSGGSPLGHICAVTSRHPKGFLRLQEVLHGAGFVGLSLRLSDESPLAFLEDV